MTEFAPKVKCNDPRHQGIKLILPDVSILTNNTYFLRESQTQNFDDSELTKLIAYLEVILYNQTHT